MSSPFFPKAPIMPMPSLPIPQIPMPSIPPTGNGVLDRMKGSFKKLRDKDKSAKVDKILGLTQGASQRAPMQFPDAGPVGRQGSPELLQQALSSKPQGMPVAQPTFDIQSLIANALGGR